MSRRISFLRPGQQYTGLLCRPGFCGRSGRISSSLERPFYSSGYQPVQQPAKVSSSIVEVRKSFGMRACSGFWQLGSLNVVAKQTLEGSKPGRERQARIKSSVVSHLVRRKLTNVGKHFPLISCISRPSALIGEMRPPFGVRTRPQLVLTSYTAQALHSLSVHIRLDIVPRDSAPSADQLSTSLQSTGVRPAPPHRPWLRDGQKYLHGRWLAALLQHFLGAPTGFGGRRDHLTLSLSGCLW